MNPVMTSMEGHALASKTVVELVLEGRLKSDLTDAEIVMVDEYLTKALEIMETAQLGRRLAEKSPQSRDVSSPY